jgi:hypothetical protein
MSLLLGLNFRETVPRILTAKRRPQETFSEMVVGLQRIRLSRTKAGKG